MEGGDPLVSVVIPTHNRPAMLEEALTSVAAQTYEHLEVIVVDDASPTPAEETVAAASIPARVIRHERNRGANRARTTGIEAATGEVIAFLDDDDRWDPAKLERQVRALRASGAGVVLVGQHYVDESGAVTSVKRPEIDGPARAALFRGKTAGSFSTMAVRRDVIEAAGMPDPELPSLQDREWLIRLAAHTTFRSLPAPLVVRRIGEYEQIGDRFVERRDQTFHRMLETHGDAAARHGLRRAFEAGLARGVAASALRAGAHADARAFALRAIRAAPTDHRGYLLALMALGGGRPYRSARRVKHRLGRLMHG